MANELTNSRPRGLDCLDSELLTSIKCTWNKYCLHIPLNDLLDDIQLIFHLARFKDGRLLLKEDPPSYDLHVPQNGNLASTTSTIAETELLWALLDALSDEIHALSDEIKVLSDRDQALAVELKDLSDEIKTSKRIKALQLPVPARWDVVDIGLVLDCIFQYTYSKEKVKRFITTLDFLDTTVAQPAKKMGISCDVALDALYFSYLVTAAGTIRHERFLPTKEGMSMLASRMCLNVHHILSPLSRRVDGEARPLEMRYISRLREYFTELWGQFFCGSPARTFPYGHIVTECDRHFLGGMAWRLTEDRLKVIRTTWNSYVAQSLAHPDQQAEIYRSWTEAIADTVLGSFRLTIPARQRGLIWRGDGHAGTRKRCKHDSVFGILRRQPGQPYALRARALD
jgi:hypothetical protein